MPYGVDQLSSRNAFNRASKGLAIYVDMKYGSDYRLVKIARKEAVSLVEQALAEELPVEGLISSDQAGRFYLLRVEDPDIYP